MNPGGAGGGGAATGGAGGTAGGGAAGGTAAGSAAAGGGGSGAPLAASTRSSPCGAGGAAAAPVAPATLKRRPQTAQVSAPAGFGWPQLGQSWVASTVVPPEWRLGGLRRAGARRAGGLGHGAALRGKRPPQLEPERGDRDAVEQLDHRQPQPDMRIGAREVQQEAQTQVAEGVERKQVAGM